MGGEDSLSAIPVEHGIELSNRLLASGRSEFSAQSHKVSFAGETLRESLNPQTIREPNDEEMNGRGSRAASIHREIESPGRRFAEQTVRGKIIRIEVNTEAALEIMRICEVPNHHQGSIHQQYKKVQRRGRPAQWDNGFA